MSSLTLQFEFLKLTAMCRIRPIDDEQRPPDAQWITLESGQHVAIGKDGTIIAGAGGALDGKYYGTHGENSPSKTITKNSKTITKNYNEENEKNLILKDISIAKIKHKTTFTEDRSSKQEAIKHVFPKLEKKQLQKIGDDLAENFNGNYDITMTGVKYSKTEQAVEYEIAGENGTHARFHFVKDGENPVKMEFVTLVAGKQKSGVAKVALANMITVAVDNNIESIDTHANMSIGGYVWTKSGFIPYQDSWDDLRAHIIKSNADTIDKKTLELLNNSDPKSIRALAEGENGKQLLMNTSWYGALNINDIDSMRIAVKYINTK